MRYYDLKILDKNSLAVIREWGSYPGGIYDPGALNVEFDCFVYPQAQPKGGSTISLEGIQLADLTNAKAFTGQIVQLRAGMGPGLPLVSPAQRGLIVQGQVFQAYGNWVGTEMTLDLVVVASPYTVTTPGNIVLNWRKGTPLSAALQNTLAVAYPKATLDIQISPIVQSFDEVGFYPTLIQLAQTLSDITSTDLTIVAAGNKITVRDRTIKPQPLELVFTDFIGQPMWIDANVIQLWTVMRADISIGSILKMPQQMTNAPGFVQTTQAAYPSQLKYKAAMQGQFVVQSVRFVGNLRAPDARSWVTVINAAAMAND